MKTPVPPRGFYKTRIAPTPSGLLHLGNAFSFALTASVARQTGANVLLRIDDLDQGRVRPEYVKDIFDSLRFLGINWQEGPTDAQELNTLYSQNLRMPLYEAALAELKRSQTVFACTCSRSELENEEGYPGTCRDKKISLDTPGACWRLKTDPLEQLTVNSYPDTVFQGEIPVSMSDFIVRKKDGSPAYQLTSLIDDVFFGIDLVVRGEDLFDSTLAQLTLARRLQYHKFEETVFVFHELIQKQEGVKLSKSDKDLSLASMISDDILPEELYFLIGSAIGLDEEIESFDNLAELLFGLPD